MENNSKLTNFNPKQNQHKVENNFFKQNYKKQGDKNLLKMLLLLTQFC